MQEVEDIFKRLRTGEAVRITDPQYHLISEAVVRCMRLSVELNHAGTIDGVRAKLGEIIGQQVDESTTLFAPFYTNVGQSISIGKNVFINHACSFLDLGGITIADDVLIGPRVNLVTENHPLDPANRKTLVCGPIMIQRSAWIGAGATILPGVTIGENAVVAAGAVVNKNVPANTVVAGVPAKVIRTIYGSD